MNKETKLIEIKLIEANLRQIYAKSVWADKIHKNQSIIYSKEFRRIENAKIILSSLTTSGVLGVVVSSNTIIDVATVILSFGTIILNAYSKNYNLQKLATEHKYSAVQYASLSNRLLSTLSQIRVGYLTIEELVKVEKQYLNEVDIIAKNSKDVSDKAISLAEEGFVTRRDISAFTDEEIDALLPDNLRYNKLCNDNFEYEHL